MSTNEDVFVPSDTEDDCREYLERRFFLCLRQINNRRINVQDDELGPITNNAGGVVYNDISDLVFNDPSEDKKLSGPVPIESAEEALRVIVKYLDKGWEMPINMRQYLSSRFTKVLNGKGRLESLFHLRESERNIERANTEVAAGDYVVFRKLLNEEILKYMTSEILRVDETNKVILKGMKKYLGARELNKMLCYELFHLFDMMNVNRNKINTLTEKSNAPNIMLSSAGDFLKAHMEQINKYKKVLNKELNQTESDDEVPGLDSNVGRQGDWRNVRLYIIKWIDENV